MEINRNKISLITSYKDKQSKKPDHGKFNSLAFNNSMTKHPDFFIKRINKKSLKHPSSKNFSSSSMKMAERHEESKKVIHETKNNKIDINEIQNVSQIISEYNRKKNSKQNNLVNLLYQKNKKYNDKPKSSNQQLNKSLKTNISYQCKNNNQFKVMKNLKFSNNLNDEEQINNSNIDFVNSKIINFGDRSNEENDVNFLNSFNNSENNFSGIIYKNKTKSNNFELPNNNEIAKKYVVNYNLIKHIDKKDNKFYENKITHNKTKENIVKKNIPNINNIIKHKNLSRKNTANNSSQINNINKFKQKKYIKFFDKSEENIYNDNTLKQNKIINKANTNRRFEIDHITEVSKKNLTSYPSKNNSNKNSVEKKYYKKIINNYIYKNSKEKKNPSMYIIQKESENLTNKINTYSKTKICRLTKKNNSLLINTKTNSATNKESKKNFNKIPSKQLIDSFLYCSNRSVEKKERQPNIQNYIFNTNRISKKKNQNNNLVNLKSAQILPKANLLNISSSREFNSKNEFNYLSNQNDSHLININNISYRMKNPVEISIKINRNNSEININDECKSNVIKETKYNLNKMECFHNEYNNIPTTNLNIMNTIENDDDNQINNDSKESNNYNNFITNLNKKKIHYKKIIPFIKKHNKVKREIFIRSNSGSLMNNYKKRSFEKMINTLIWHKKNYYIDNMKKINTNTSLNNSKQIDLSLPLDGLTFRPIVSNMYKNFIYNNKTNEIDQFLNIRVNKIYKKNICKSNRSGVNDNEEKIVKLEKKPVKCIYNNKIKKIENNNKDLDKKINIQNYNNFNFIGNGAKILLINKEDFNKKNICFDKEIRNNSNNNKSCSSLLNVKENVKKKDSKNKISNKEKKYFQGKLLKNYLSSISFKEINPSKLLKSKENIKTKEIKNNKLVKKTNTKIEQFSKIKLNSQDKKKESENTCIEMLCEPVNILNKRPKILSAKSSAFTTTLTHDSDYYKKEMENLCKFIKNYYKENNSYPPTNKNFYLYGRQIGKGAFGKVHLALHLGSGHLVAVKIFYKKNLKNNKTNEKIKNEIEILSKLRHPFISQILDSFETEKHIFIIMEYICGDLLSFLRKRGKISESTSKILFKQLIEGLKYIHKKNIIHRDIKLDNILIDLTNTVKICDFGVSKKIKNGEIMYDHCGTPSYIAPEIFENKGYEGFSCDIWSAGITLYYMLSGNQPFNAESINELEKKILMGNFEKIKNISDDANDLIEGMLKVDPKKRLSISEILNHPWLKNTNINNRKKIILFTEAEKNLYSKFDINYFYSRNSELVENFTNKNLDTKNDESKSIGQTKSLIYAPYNSYLDPEKPVYYESYKIEDEIYKELEINNEICKFGHLARQDNINYELSNNIDFDNGLIKTQKEADFNKKNEIIEKKQMDEIFDIDIKHAKIKSANDSFEESEKIVINKELLKEIEKNIGYDKKFVIDCLKKNKINYATATYYLLNKKNE